MDIPDIVDVATSFLCIQIQLTITFNIVVYQSFLTKDIDNLKHHRLCFDSALTERSADIIERNSHNIKFKCAMLCKITIQKI